MTHRLALVSTYRFGNEPRAIPDCHLWEMAHRILQKTNPGEISRFRMLPRISTVSTTCQTAESGSPFGWESQPYFFTLLVTRTRQNGNSLVV